MRSSLAALLLPVVLLGVTGCKIAKRPPATAEAARPAASSPAQPPAPATAWSTTAASYRGQNGQRFPFLCSGQAVLGSVWGSDIYTDDSSICTAAVHAGLIDTSGGRVTIEIRPGQPVYVGSVRRGIASKDYGAWGGSFVFLDAKGKAIEPPAVQGQLATWSLNATQHRGANDTRITYTCPPGGAFGSVWGTDVYTDDSSICTAAVHAGLIGQSGGTVTIEIRRGEPSYKGSVRNGVSSGDYGQWSGSYVFVK